MTAATGLEINLSTLAEIASPPVTQVGATTASGETTRVAVVSAEVLEETARRYEGCRCDELGLVEGLPVNELIYLGSGCTGETIDGRKIARHNRAGWVCQRLDLVRRRYGK